MEIGVIPGLAGRWIYRVCHAHELEKLTREGWQFEKEIVEMDHEPACDQVAVFVPYSGGGGHVDNRTVTKVMPVRRVSFLLKRDEDSLLVKALEDVKRLEAINSDHVRAIKKGVDELVAMKQQNDDLINSAKYEAERRDEQNERYEKMCSAKSKLESDISKIRRAIGEKTMKEILEATS